MSFPDGPMQDATLVADILGEKCPDCGWRGGQHKPGGVFLGEPCPQLVAALEDQHETERELRQDWFA